MIYEFPIITETDDTSSSPKKTTIKLCKGIVHQLDIICDIAVMGTLYLAIAHGLHQIFPTNQEEYFRLTGRPFSFRESYELNSRPYSFYVYTYLENAQEEHEVRVRLGLLREVDLKEVIIKYVDEE